MLKGLNNSILILCFVKKLYGSAVHNLRVLKIHLCIIRDWGFICSIENYILIYN